MNIYDLTRKYCSRYGQCKKHKEQSQFPILFPVHNTSIHFKISVPCHLYFFNPTVCSLIYVFLFQQLLSTANRFQMFYTFLLNILTYSLYIRYSLFELGVFLAVINYICLSFRETTTSNHFSDISLCTPDIQPLKYGTHNYCRLKSACGLL